MPIADLDRFCGFAERFLTDERGRALVMMRLGHYRATAGNGPAPDLAARAVDRLRQTLEDHYDDAKGVAIDSRSWLITARTVPRPACTSPPCSGASSR